MQTEEVKYSKGTFEEKISDSEDIDLEIDNDNIVNIVTIIVSNFKMKPFINLNIPPVHNTRKHDWNNNLKYNYNNL